MAVCVAYLHDILLISIHMDCVSFCKKNNTILVEKRTGFNAAVVFCIVDVFGYAPENDIS